MTVTVLQAWLFAGIPALVLGLAMFVGRSLWRSLVGYMVLFVGFGVMAFFDRGSAAVFGTLIALLYAAGRGGRREREFDPVSATSHKAVEAGG